MPQTKIQTITLTTQTKEQGECVARDPSQLTKNRSDIDVIRLLNSNALGSGKAIAVHLIQSDSASQLFHPVPATNTNLNPGEFVDWPLSGTGGVKFRTQPKTCGASDENDIIIKC